MIVQIEINTGGPEFCCGRAGSAVAMLLADVMVELKDRRWMGVTELEFPIKSGLGRVVGNVTVKHKLESQPRKG